MSGQQSAPVTAIAPQSAEKAVEFQAFGSSEKVQLSINIVRKWLVTPTRSGKTATDSDVMKFIMLCKARQLNPWEGDAFLVGYDSNNGPSFSLITAHQAFLKRAEVHPQYDGMESGVIVKDDKGGMCDLPGDFVPLGYVLLGGWAKVYRKDQTHPKIARLNLEIFDKGRSIWNTNKPGMIVKCAEADGLRGAFPNTLGGMYNDAEQSLIHASAGNGHVEPLPKPAVISEDQRTTLVNLAQECGVVEKLGTLANAAGFEMLAHITVDKYEEFETAIRTLGYKGEGEGEVVDAEYVEVEPDLTRDAEVVETVEAETTTELTYEELLENVEIALQGFSDGGKKFLNGRKVKAMDAKALGLLLKELGDTI